MVAAACLYIILGVHFLLFPLVLNSECNCLSNYCVYSIIWIIFKNILPKNCTWKLASWLTLPYSHKCWSMCCPYKQIKLYLSIYFRYNPICGCTLLYLCYIILSWAAVVTEPTEKRLINTTWRLPGFTVGCQVVSTMP